MLTNVIGTRIFCLLVRNRWRQKVRPKVCHSAVCANTTLAVEGQPMRGSYFAMGQNTGSCEAAGESCRSIAGLGLELPQLPCSVASGDVHREQVPACQLLKRAVRIQDAGILGGGPHVT